jgi:SagB-type dehydrogenase family enzyme
MIDFSKLFHQSSKDHTQGGAVRAIEDHRDWPEAWKTVYYKSYPRFEKIELPKPERTADFYSLVQKRKSERDFRKEPMDVGALSTLLQYSCGVTKTGPQGSSRAQASGGARYPIEVYPIVFRGSEALRSGLYHYNVRDHALDVLWRRPFDAAQIGELFTYEWVQDATAIILMTAVFERNQMKYGERGYRYMLLEAGHIGQNIYLNAAALGLKCCALGGTRDENLEKLLGIDGVTESVVYAVALG